MFSVDYLVTCVFVGFVLRGLALWLATVGCVCWFVIACVGLICAFVGCL